MYARWKREQVIRRIYRRRPVSPDRLIALARRSLKLKRGFALVRAGDYSARLLAGKWRRIRAPMWRFLGIPCPPPRRLIRELQFTYRRADVVGLTHLAKFAPWLARTLRLRRIRPRLVADSFINDTLFETGRLWRLIRGRRVVLVGRQAKHAARRLSRLGYRVVAAHNLDGWHNVSPLYRQLQSTAGDWDLVLSGAGLPGRILCTRLARRLNKVALEIGHVMEGIARPHLWRHPRRRQVFKRRYFHRWGLNRR